VIVAQDGVQALDYLFGSGNKPASEDLPAVCCSISSCPR